MLTGRAFVWQTSNDAVATVGGDGSTATVTAKSTGPVTISATSECRKGDGPITITLIPIAALVVTPDTATLTMGGTRQLSAVARDASGNALTGRQVSWTSSDTTKAKVSGSGMVTATGTGTATITASAEGKNAPVTIMVVAAPAIELSLTSVSFSALPGQTASQTVNVTNAGGGTVNGLSGIVTYASGQPSGWLTASLNSTTAAATLTLQASAANLQPRTYSATVTIRSSISGVAEKSVGVTFTVGQGPAIGLSNTTVSFAATAGQGNPAAQTVNVSNDGGGTLTGLSGIITYTAGQPSGWLTASLNSTTAPATLTLSANTAGLTAGTYNTTVTIRSSLAGLAEKTVAVTLTVTAAPQPQIGISPTSISFSATGTCH